ncbi:substrate-binding domain-containing protein [Erwinia sp. E602]|uniref:DNA-binding transcriptional regulator IdnR n=1 Tax=unclassified Erwinia TaxID=2622719 RepID=UPI0006F5E7B9|nr:MULTISPECIES: LacI family DNA-binding transcriptional regulator [unclassified Erwinia]KQN57961.1 transcriptional regulator [Erwinia sp. Leaf53]PLV62703.1 transcriptional regulator [Erwinia sp. B116]QUG77263.1 substrate-binding domain-containing protein [Erwinia sp. E602]
MRSHRISLQDIATLAGVTKMTVSRYLRTPERVSPETGAKIAEIIEEINYIPNRAPEMLLSSKSYTLGVLIPSFKNQIFADLLSGIEAATKEGRYQTLIANYNYDRQAEEEQIINLLSYSIDGILLSEKDHTVRAVKYLRAAKIPIVEVMDTEGGCLDMEVGFNNFSAGYDMTRTLLDRGRRRIVYFGSQDDRRDESRYRGYCQAMSERGGEARRVNPKAISSQKLGATMLASALARYPDLDAIFCTNDDLALGALLHCQRNRIDVPGRIAISGFHGLDISREMYPTLASVITPRYAIGYTAAELLLKRINDSEFSAGSVDLSYQIFMGETISGG